MDVSKLTLDQADTAAKLAQAVLREQVKRPVAAEAPTRGEREAVAALNDALVRFTHEIRAS